MTRKKLAVDWARCTGHLVCAELLPELISVDDWGYPMVANRPVPDQLRAQARRARAGCPVMALRLRSVEAPAEVTRRADA